MYALINCASSKSQLGARALQKARQHVCVSGDSNAYYRQNCEMRIVCCYTGLGLWMGKLGSMVV